MIFIEKFDPKKIVTAVYFDGEQKKYYLKRFQIPESSVVNKKYGFIPETKGSKLVEFSLDYLPRVEMELKSGKNNEIEFEIVPAADFIAVKSYKAKGKRLTTKEVKKIKFIEPLPYTPPDDDNEYNDEEEEKPEDEVMENEAARENNREDNTEEDNDVIPHDDDTPPPKVDPETGQLELF
jgi:topoisomerase-4 subunit A